MTYKDLAHGGFAQASKRFLEDLDALPESAFTHSFGPATRTVADIVYEVNLVNKHVAMTLRDEEPFAWPEGGWITAPEGFDSKSVVTEAFRSTSEMVLSTLEGLSEEQFLELQATDQGEKTRLQQCQFMSMHVWYHSGQLNFIQTLLGDSDWHWS